MSIAGRAAFIVGAIIIAAWLYWLTGRVQNLLTLAEQIVDRDHGPALPPERHQPAMVRHEPARPVTVYTVSHRADPGEVPRTVPMPVPEPKTDEVPVVRPIPPRTQPAAAVLVAHWAEGVDDFQARQDRMLQEARERIRMIAEGAA